jgi:hypothetical protein
MFLVWQFIIIIIIIIIAWNPSYCTVLYVKYTFYLMRK